jgi:hypothetical protein
MDNALQIQPVINGFLVAELAPMGMNLAGEQRNWVFPSQDELFKFISAHFEKQKNQNIAEVYEKARAQEAQQKAIGGSIGGGYPANPLGQRYP